MLRAIRPGRGLCAGLVLILGSLVFALGAGDGGQTSSRLRGMRDELGRLQEELEQLEQREQGLLGALERVGAELRLRQGELDTVLVEIEEVSGSIAVEKDRLAELLVSQQRRESYLAFRLREMYKSGPETELRHLLESEVEGFWEGLRYAAYLSDRDGRVLDEFRRDAQRIRDHRDALMARHDELEGLRRDRAIARRRLESSRERRRASLLQVRDDSEKRRLAVEELEAASVELGRLADSFPSEVAAARLDVRKFRGLLDWPTSGTVSQGYGTVIHPRFRTRIPHPGLDIDGPFGAPIRAVFEGRIVFASWLRGYGLTVIVDHGAGVLSIYAHASVLLVEAGDTVLRGQKLGTVGDTGSMRGPYLYFELRVDGRSSDPGGWLRPEDR